MHRLKLFLSAALMVTFLVACNETDEPPSEPGPPAGSETPATPGRSPLTFSCPGSDESVAVTSSGTLMGDVDGDGTEDEVQVFRNDQGAPGCEGFLVAGSSTAVLSEEGMTPGLGLPALVDLVQVDGRPGLDMVVRLLTGASTEFLGVYTMDDGDLRPLQIDDPVASGLFAYGGSVTHLDAVDCDDQGRVVTSSASFEGDAYRVTRTTYEVEGGELVPIDVGNVRMTEGEVSDGAGEFSGAPFGNCPRD